LHRYSLLLPLLGGLEMSHLARTHLVVLGMSLVGVSCSFLGAGPPDRYDVTNKPREHGDFKLNAIYELRHGAYLYRSDNDAAEYQVMPPTRFGPSALRNAEEVFGDARKAPLNFEYPAAEGEVRGRGVRVLPPVESRAANEALPPKCIGTLPAGTRFQFVRLIVETKGENYSLLYLARVIGRDDLGDRVLISALSNSRHWGFTTPKAHGASPNPFMLSEVESDSTIRPATTAPAE
jgi:hypothetical protein